MSLWKSKKLEDIIGHLWRGLTENVGYSGGVLLNPLQEYESSTKHFANRSWKVLEHPMGHFISQATESWGVLIEVTEHCCRMLRNCLHKLFGSQGELLVLLLAWSSLMSSSCKLT